MRQHALASALRPDSRSPSPEPLTHFQEQAALRSETITAFHTAVSEDEDDELLVPREKTKDELQQEEEEYKTFLEQQVGEDIGELIKFEDDERSPVASTSTAHREGGKKRKKESKAKGGKSKEDENQEFLMK